MSQAPELAPNPRGRFLLDKIRCSYIKDLSGRQHVDKFLSSKEKINGRGEGVKGNFKHVWLEFTGSEPGKEGLSWLMPGFH